MKRLVCVLIGCSLAPVAWSYEIETHADMSVDAARRSILSDTKFLQQLGVQDPLDTEEQRYPNSKGDQRNIPDLISDGARFEDGFTCSDPRSRHHFYNPLTGSGLQWVFDGEPSPDWALEDTRAIDSQAFSYRDARTSLYQGLTTSTKEERKKFLGLTFQTLGQVIHHLQDMAQPQHVRNDVHYFPPENCGLASVLGELLPKNRSLYEQYTDRDTVRPRLPFGGYDNVRFKMARDFWHTDDRRGIADYTNRGFVSEGTIAPEAFLEPILSEAEAVDVRSLFPGVNLAVPNICNSDVHPCFMTFYENQVLDALTGQNELNDRAASRSLFDQDLALYNGVVTLTDPITGEHFLVNQISTLNRFNFDRAHEFLIKRAVGYSAGLIDYFFRGRIDLDIDYDSTTVGQYLIRNEGDEDMHGAFTLYYDAVDGKRYPLAGDAADITWKDVTVPKNGTSPSLTPPILPEDPKPKRPDEYFLVFKGQMGQEKPLDDDSVGAVVAKSKRKLLWEPWREQLTDNHPWHAGAGTVNNQVGPNSQTLQNGHLILFSGVGGAGFVEWQAENAEDAVASRFMKIRLNCSQSALTEDFNVFGYLSVGPDLFRSQTIPFAGGVGAESSAFNLFPRATEQQEYVIDLGRIGIAEVGYLDINTIGFDQDLTCAIDYIDFSDQPFTQVAAGAIKIP